MMMKITSRSPSDRFPSRRSRAAVVSVWILIRISTLEGLLQDQYIGCFYDDHKATDHIAAISTDKAVSIQDCISLCQKYDATYAGFQNGNICHCRNDYGFQLGQPDPSCNLICSENKSHICGGFKGQRITYSLFTVCPIGTYGSACDKGCHCKHDIPCDRITGNCSDGCYGNWIGPTCNKTTDSYQYIGCYKDHWTTRAMELRSSDRESNSPQSCSKTCAEKNYSYAGLQYYNECFCGDSYSRYGPSNACIFTCTGDRSTSCGGTFAISVYSVCPIGTYGKSCTGRCECYNVRRCIYRNGSCPTSQCEPGWTGISCNISLRGCSRNNGDCSINEKCTAIDLTDSTVSVCLCPTGFQRSSLRGNCTDTDECSLNVCDNGTMICANAVGSYNCSCRSGFQTHNATACKDIDECVEKVCDADTMLCTNAFGSYNCSCRRGFETHNTTACTDADECSLNVCDNGTTTCINTIGSYNCSCKSGFQPHNDTACTEVEASSTGSIGAAVGSISAVIVVVIIAFLLLFCYCRRRKGLSESKPYENNKSQAINPSQGGDESEQLGLHSCKSEIGDSSRNKTRHKVTHLSKGKSADHVNVQGKLRRSPKGEAGLNTDSDVTTYESLNAVVSGFDETRIYADLKLYE